MRKFFFISFFFLATISYAQYKISGTITASNKQTSALLYKIQDLKLTFVQKTQLTKNRFQFLLPENSVSGMYRIIYDPQNNRFIDVIFHQENIDFKYNDVNGLSTIQFVESAENREYQLSMKLIGNAHKILDSLQLAYLQDASKKTATAYQKKSIAYLKTKNSILERSKKLFVKQIIQANFQHYSPEVIPSAKDYLDYKYTHFFDAISFNNEQITNSSLFIDKITDFVFYLNTSDNQKTQEKIYKKGVNEVVTKATNPILKKNIIELLLYLFTSEKKTSVVDFILENYFKKLPLTLQDTEFKQSILEELATEIGRTAPDFSWSENSQDFALSKLKSTQNYVLVFWSTSCSHCRKEIPELYTFTKEKTNVKVIAFGMETNADKWANFTKPLKKWHHALGLGKWENETAKMYQIYSTPSYFVLNENKKIIAKPETLEGLKNIIGLMH